MIATKDVQTRMLQNYYAVRKWRELDRYVYQPHIVEQDRVFAVASSRVVSRLNFLVDRGFLGRFPNSGHKIPSVSPTMYREVANYRGRLHKSVAGDQWIVYSTSENVTVVEMDIDIGSPVDLVGVFSHAWEVLCHQFRGRKTDPFKVAKLLAKSGILEDE